MSSEPTAAFLPPLTRRKAVNVTRSYWACGGIFLTGLWILGFNSATWRSMERFPVRESRIPAASFLRPLEGGEPSIESYSNKLFGEFDEFLTNEYLPVHARAIEDHRSGNGQGVKFVQFLCDGVRECGGWADRVRGMFTAAIMAFALNRTLVVDVREMSTRLDEVYDPKLSGYDWSYIPDIPRRKRLSINCMPSKISAACALSVVFPGNMTTLDYADQFDMIVYRGNKLHQLSQERGFNRSERLRRMLDGDFYWRGKLFRALFKPGVRLNQGIERIVQAHIAPQPGHSSDRILNHLLWSGIPTIGIHVRSGKNPKDKHPRFFRVSFEEIAKMYSVCFEQVLQAHGLSAANASVFVAADMDEALNTTVRMLKDRGVSRIITGEALGGIGHLELDKNQDGDLVFRMHAEFELLRVSKYIILNRSGWSYAALQTRYRVDEESATSVLQPGCGALTPENAT